MSDYPRTVLAGILPLLVLLLLACGNPGIPTGATPRWACPSPMPLPYGDGGPVKDVQVVATADPLTGTPAVVERRYYAIWEQEYGHLGGPPFPSPTVYARIGLVYAFGQRVEIGALHVLVDGQAGAIQPDGRQLYMLAITWLNRSLEPVPIIYPEHVRLRAINDARTGAVISDDRWGVSTDSMLAAAISALPTQIPVGSSSVVVPILAPPGTPEVIEIAFAGRTGYLPVMPSVTTLPGTATATPVVTPTRATITPNTELRAHTADDQLLRVQWTNATWVPPGGQPCGDAGAITAWSTTGRAAWGVDVPLEGVAAPAGAARVVQIAMNQVGKAYVWGAKGPEQFDCSGLVSWSYAQIGIAIPAGTAGQWPHMTPVSAAAIQPGDLIFFDMDGGSHVNHVGMLVGDINGDGRWDMVHAANPQLGVRMVYGVLQSAYYQQRILGFRTARG